ncbi:helicase C-terminal domain-containing protein [Thalassobacillus hwangdonensis]|uniref:Helicase C-terminal domain-containing protein n=1 Tax=Thalassobacillus hwangdonensis TaxID=546108 RepID=A0ABW3L1S7_9BACI
MMKISVRSLVEYVFRTGSIDNRFRSSTALTEGTEIHQQVQREYKEGDEKELFLKKQFEKDGFSLLVHGRCDGLLKDKERIIIDEIKSTSLALEELTEESYPVYWAQAKGYAFLYADDHGLPEIDVQLTYVQKKTREKKRFLHTFSYDELEDFMGHAVETYASYGRILAHIKQQKEATIPDLSFPFSGYRKGQRKLAGSVYKTVTEKRKLFAQAPTGIGKTISTLFPAIKAMEGEGVERLFYLTAKTVTRMTGEEALERLAAQGLRLRSVTLTAKDKICFKEETICQPDYCEFADGYYDRINGAIVDILMNETQMTRNVVESYARKHRICPFEFSIDLAYAVDVIICDYNYIFDPRVALKRLMSEDKKHTAILVDEAHNLVERSREMYSAVLTKDEFVRLKQMDGMDESLNQVVDAIESEFRNLNANHDAEGFVHDEVPGPLEESLDRFITEADSVLREMEEDAEELLSCYFNVQNFMKILQLVDDHYVIFGQKGNENGSIHLYCLDPSLLVGKISSGFASSIFFSATLSPFGYYKDMLGGAKEDYILKLPSPYAKEQMQINIFPLSTRYKDRERTSMLLAMALYDMVSETSGNHLFFFPSYHYMEQVYREWLRLGVEADTIIQDFGMSENERDSFLAAFQPDLNKPLVGFAVLGGVFSEGVDLRGERLNGVAVVGIGLAPRSFEKELIKEYFNEKGKNGYDYAYVYPGMNKVLQAGGRLIRSEEDKGKILLVDDRFLTNKYNYLLPEEWKHYTVIR